MEPPCLFMPSVTQVGEKEKKTSMLILFVNEFLKFPIISNLSSRWD